MGAVGALAPIVYNDVGFSTQVFGQIILYCSSERWWQILKTEKESKQPRFQIPNEALANEQVGINW